MFNLILKTSVNLLKSPIRNSTICSRKKTTINSSLTLTGMLNNPNYHYQVESEAFYPKDRSHDWDTEKRRCVSFIVSGLLWQITNFWILLLLQSVIITLSKSLHASVITHIFTLLLLQSTIYFFRLFSRAPLFSVTR